jgi:hypothetical protein
MSGPLRFRTATVLVLAGLSNAPASANILDTLFNRTPDEASSPAPAQDATAKDASAKDAPAKDECLSRPGKPVDGQHWMYRLDGHRRCWFMVPEENATSRQRARHHTARRRLATSEENEVAPRQRKAVVDARAELVRPAPEDTLQPTPVPALRMVDAAASVPAANAAPSVPATGAAALVPPPPILAKPDAKPDPKPDPKPDQLPSDRADAPQQPDVPKDNVETLLAAAPASSEPAAASVPPATTVAFAMVTGEDEPWWRSRWLGPMLMGLGLISLLIATLPVRRPSLVARNVRAPEPEEPLSVLSDSDPQTDLQHYRPSPAMRSGGRQIAGRERNSRPSSPGHPDRSFQEAIRALTDFDPASVEASPGALTPRRPDVAPASRSTRTYASRTS